MILKNLLRRKTRTFLTVLGISIGVAAIISLGAMANGLEAGYSSLLSGSRADLVLSQPDAIELSYSTVDEKISDTLKAMPEVETISGMIQGFVTADNAPYFFIFGYPTDSFALERFNVIRGMKLNDPESLRQRGTPIMVGTAAAESLKKTVGDTLRLSGSSFRITGIYQTGDAFEDSGAVMALKDAQELLNRPRQVSLFFIKLKDPALRERLETRVARQWKDLTLSSTSELSDKQVFDDSIQGLVWVIAGLAILLGGVGMMNAQLMAVFERTREIGVLRALGWSRRRVLWMILGETMLVCLAGGVLGAVIGWGALALLTRSVVMLGASTASVTPEILGQALVTVLVLGVTGGLYPARRAANLQPIEALRYEGGSGGEQVHRLPIGGMALQSLWQRTTRTILTLSVIGLTVGAIIALASIMLGFTKSMDSMSGGGKMQVMVRQADIADTSLSAIDERFGQLIAALPNVENVSGMIFTAVAVPESQGFMIIEGLEPRGFMIQRFKIISGNPLSNNRQILVGKTIAEALKKGAGDTIQVGGSRFEIVGVYETGVGWEEMGSVMTLRDAQAFVGRPRKVTLFGIRLREPRDAQILVDRINREFPELHAALSGDFVEDMPDMQVTGSIIDGISLLAIVVGGLGVMNTMLMAVLERTREIGVLRSVGWRRRDVLVMIFKESLTLALLGAAAGIVIALVLVPVLMAVPAMKGMVEPEWTVGIMIRAVLIALLLGAVGGIYPAYQATRLQPIEALRYE